MSRPNPGRGGRGRGRGRRQIEPPETTAQELQSWFAGALPDDWFVEPPTIQFDRDEIVVVGTLPLPKLGPDDNESIAATSRIAAFRESSREERMAIADQAQATFLRTVSWAAECGPEAADFKRATVPVMTRLGLEDRAVLDTLIDAGVARSRSEALAWCVQLVAENEADWIEKLRAAMQEINEVREAGPDSRS